MEDGRREVEAYFDDEHLIPGSETEELSPSGRYWLAVTRYRRGGRLWDYTRGRVVRVADGKLVCDVKRNLHHFHRTWLTKDGSEWLVAGRSYMSQTLVDLDRGLEYEPPGDRYQGDAFCWAAVFLSPDERTLAVEGCIWGRPYEYRFFDFTDPASGWPALPMAEANERESLLPPEWRPDGTFECLMTRGTEVVGHTRIAREGDRMIVAEREISDEERERRAVEAAEEAWWERFTDEDPLYRAMDRALGEHKLPWTTAKAPPRTILRRVTRATPPASADLEWSASEGAIRTRTYDDKGRLDDELEFDRSTDGMARAVAFIARRFRSS